MIQLTSSSTSSCHLLTLLIVLLVFINNHQISANSLSNKLDYQPINELSYEDNDDSDSTILYIPDNEEITSRNPWSHLFHHYSDRSVGSPTYYSRPQSAFNLRRGEIHYIPYPFQKRAIPIEFQKALFAHGIVGRR